MKSSFYIKIVLFASAAVLCFGNRLSANDLIDIRTGYHKSYSRLVLEFNGPVRFQVLEHKENPAIIVDIFRGGEILNFREVRIDSNDPFIRQVRFKKDGHLISIIAFLKNRYFKISQSQLNWPFRIVVDIYSSGTQLQTAVAHKTRSARKLDIAVETEEAVKPDSAKSILNVDTESAVSDSSDFIVDAAEQAGGNSPIIDDFLPKVFDIKSLTSPVTQNITKDEEPQKGVAKTKTNLIWLIGGAFIFFDVVLLSFYFLKRGKTKLPDKAITQNSSRKRKFRRNAPQPAKLKRGAFPQNNEALVSPAFLPYLNDALEKQQQEPVNVSAKGHHPDELREISKAIKLDTLIGTLTEAVNIKTDTPPPTNKPPAPPEFKEIVVDLNLDNSETTEAAAKRELIGKDGQEFMQNIKRLYLN